MNLIFVAPFLISLALAGGHKALPDPDTLPKPVPTVEAPAPTPTPAVQVKGIEFTCEDCDPQEKVKILASVKKANEVVQGKCFGEFFLKWDPIHLDGRTPVEALAHIRGANLSVPVHYYYSAKKVVGYRSPPAPDIYLNRKYHKYYGVCDTASSATHEWSHTLGYGHPYYATPTRGRTVPYTINHAFDACCGDSKGYIQELLTK